MSSISVDRYKAVIAVVLGAIAGALGFVSSIDGLAATTKNIVISAVISNEQVDVEPWLPYALVIGAALSAFAALVGIAFTLIAISNLKSIKTDPRLKRSREVIRGLLSANREIVDKLYSAEDYPEYIFDEIEYNIDVDKNGSAVVFRREHLRAHKTPVTFWTQGMFADPEADAVESFADLIFVANQTAGKGKIVPLPIADEPRQKRVALFCLPKVELDEADARAVVTTFQWPAMMKKLLIDREMEWTWTLWSAKPVKKFEAGFYFDPSLTPIECVTIGLVPKEARLERATNAKGWSGWKYSCEEAKADRFKYAFQFRRTPDS